MPWDFSRKDWQDRIRLCQSLMPDLPLWRDEADRAVAIFNKLRIPDVADRPRFETAAGDWFREIVRALFGSVDPTTRRRLVREILLLIAKKNSKTTNGAGLMMTALLMNTRPRAEFHLIGPTQGISDLAFDQAVGMIEADDIKSREERGKRGALQEMLHVQQHLKRITYRGTREKPGTGARLRIKTFSEEILTGPRPAGVLLDEIHLLGKDPKAAGIVGQLRGGMTSNLEAFLAMLTTQSDEPPAGIFLNELTRARMVRDGELEGDDLLPILFEFPDDIMESRDELWRDPANWPMVNPNLGRSVHLELLKSDWLKAQNTGDSEVRRWASQHLNIQIGVALKSNSWKGAKHWEKNAVPAIAAHHAELAKAKAGRDAKRAARLAELAELLATCDVATIGADGGGLDDLYGLAVLGRKKGAEPNDRRSWRVWSHAWCFRSVLAERQDIAPRLLDFEQDGDLTIIDDAGEDVDQIADIIMTVEDSGLLPEKCAIGMDQVGIAEAIEEIGRRAFDITQEGGRVVGIPQGWKLNKAIKETERRLQASRLEHNGSALMNFCLGSAKVTPRGNAVSIDKANSGNAKIDPLMAVFNAVVLMSLNPEPTVSVFDLLADEKPAQAGVAGELSAEEEAAILSDTRHPRWHEVRDAWERRNLKPDDDELEMH